MRCNESVEMYLETILLLKKHYYGREVHACDVAAERGYSRASVSRAVKRLESCGYITVLENVIGFTPLGEQLANDVYARHGLIKRLLIHIGAEEALAEHDACLIEHVVSPELMPLIRAYLEA